MSYPAHLDTDGSVFVMTTEGEVFNFDSIEEAKEEFEADELFSSDEPVMVEFGDEGTVESFEEMTFSGNSDKSLNDYDTRMTGGALRIMMKKIFDADRVEYLNSTKEKDKTVSYHYEVYGHLSRRRDWEDALDKKFGQVDGYRSSTVILPHEEADMSKSPTQVAVNFEE